MKAKLSSALLAGSLLTAGAQYAQADEPSGVYVHPALGHYWFDDDRNQKDTNLAYIGAGYKFASRWAAEVAYTQEISDRPYDFSLWTVSGLYYLTEPRSWRPFLIAGAGQMTVEQGSSEYDDEHLNAGIGILGEITDNLSLRADIRALLGNDDSDRDTLATIGLSYLIGDNGKRASKPAPAPVAAPKDSDGDGVVDSADQCPGTAPDTRVDSKGCMMMVDSDKDGVYDHMDKCPGTATGLAVDAKGCAIPGDADGDGIKDTADQCPATPKGVEVTLQGCPVDRDGDKVADYMDACLNTPAGAKVDDKGCRIKLLKNVSMKLEVNFRSGSTTVDNDSMQEVEKLAKFMKEYPDADVTIEGHTDSSGPEQLNQRLSQKRADSVKSALVQNFGIDIARITAIGYGESRPIADNNTREGKKANRRVVAEINAKKEVYQQ